VTEVEIWLKVHLFLHSSVFLVKMLASDFSTATIFFLVVASSYKPVAHLSGPMKWKGVYVVLVFHTQQSEPRTYFQIKPHV